MAKKKKEFTFSEVGTIIENSIKTTSIIIEDVNSNTNREFIGTGIYLLNALLSKSILHGGIQSNRITAFAGESGSGKSFMCYNICREAQKKGWNIIYIDTEQSIELDNLPNFGLDISPDRFTLLRSNVVEDLKIMLAKMIKDLKEAKDEGSELPKILMIVDSAGQLASRKELSDAQEGKEKVDMTRAKAIGSMFRIINADLGYLNIPMIVTNHTYLTTDMFPQEVMKGGRSLYYTASTVVFVSKAKLKTGEEDDMDLNQSGIVVTAKASKNRLAKPKKIKFEISFTGGANPYKGLEAFCIPEYFDKVGIALGKMEVDKSTGEMVFKPGGIKWYVRHLDKSISSKQLHTPAVFTKEVLEALDPIISEYFSYSSLEEMNQLNSFVDVNEDDSDDDESGINVADVVDEDLF